MKRLHLMVEGQTEETVAREVLVPYFETSGWVVSYSIVTTKIVPAGPNHRGGLASWLAIRPQLQKALRGRFDLVTTMFDYYGLPRDTPRWGTRPSNDALARVRWVEQGIADDLADRRFLPHLMMHETEALVFAARRELAGWLGDPGLLADLDEIVDKAGGPELVNDGPMSAPSKRLIERIPTYAKRSDGPNAIAICGLEALRAQCPHFDAWVRRIESA